MQTSSPFQRIKLRTMMIPASAGLLMAAGTAAAQSIRYPSEIKPSKRIATGISTVPR